MPNLRAVAKNVWDLLTVTCADELDAMPATNTQNVSRSHVLRAPTTFIEAGPPDYADLIIQGSIEDEADVRANCLYFFRHNLYGKDVEVEFFSDDAFTTSVHVANFTVDAMSPAGSTYDWGHVDSSDDLRFDPLRGIAPFEYFLPSTIVFKSVRITIEDPPQTPEICRIWMGVYREMSVNPDFGAMLGIGSNGGSQRTRGGSLIGNPGAKWRTLSMALSRLTEEERAFWLDVMHICGTDKDFVLSLFPADATSERKARDYAGNWKFTSLDAMSLEIGWRTKRITAQEC